MKSPHVNVTFSIDDWDTDLSWDQMRATMTPFFDRDDLPDLLAQIARCLEVSEDAPLQLRGTMYMSGRLPDKTTYDRKGNALPGIVVVDDVNAWPGRLPKKLRDPSRT